MQYLARVDFQAPGFGEFYDELPLWSAPFGLMFDHLERRLNAVASARGGLTLTVPTVCLVAHKPEGGV